AYARGEIIRPLKIGCKSSVSLAELWPEACVFVGKKKLCPKGPAIMKQTTVGDWNIYAFSPC
ncbi:hypothetical protein AAVH_17096, partial [Aphelenchoides avenae]